MDILELYHNHCKNGDGIAVLPVRGLFIESPFSIEGVYYATATDIGGMDILLKEIDDRSFLPIEPISDDIYKSELTGDSLRRFASSLSNLSKEILSNSTLAVLPVSLNWDNFESQSHNDDIEVLSVLSHTSFRALDLVRFQFCQLALPDTLPGVPGYWENSQGFFGAAVLGPTGRGRLLGGKKTGVGMVEGLGLELDTGKIASINSGKCSSVFKTKSHGGEIGDAARHGMHMLSRAMYSNNDTMKFLAIMALFEYLGTGPEYTKFEEVRKKIQPHIAKNHEKYKRLSERFKELSSKKYENKKNAGFRHRIVHEGCVLEEILPVEKNRRSLFAELDRYAGKIIYDMCQKSSYTWVELQKLRVERTKKILAQ